MAQENVGSAKSCSKRTKVIIHKKSILLETESDIQVQILFKIKEFVGNLFHDSCILSVYYKKISEWFSKFVANL